MATDEASFKLEFKKDLRNFLPESMMWANSDKFTSGLPDFCVIDSAKFIAIEAKFTKALPKRPTSKVLDHPVSAAQKAFLCKVLAQGLPAFVLIGTPTAAVIMDKIQENYTLEECLTAPRILKENGRWKVEVLCEFWRH